LPLAALVFLEAQVFAIFDLVFRLHVAAEIRAIDLNDLAVAADALNAVGRHRR
jgi:hypothetical protein